MVSPRTIGRRSHMGRSQPTPLRLAGAPPRQSAYPGCMSAVAKLRAEALALPEDDRLDLAADLLASVHGGMTPEWEAAWMAECRRRVAEVDAGTVTPIAADEVMANLRARLAAR